MGERHYYITGEIVQDSDPKPKLQWFQVSNESMVLLALMGILFTEVPFGVLGKLISVALLFAVGARFFWISFPRLQASALAWKGLFYTAYVLFYGLLALNQSIPEIFQQNAHENAVLNQKPSSVAVTATATPTPNTYTGRPHESHRRKGRRRQVARPTPAATPTPQHIYLTPSAAPTKIAVLSPAPIPATPTPTPFPVTFPNISVETSPSPAPSFGPVHFLFKYPINNVSGQAIYIASCATYFYASSTENALQAANTARIAAEHAISPGCHEQNFHRLDYGQAGTLNILEGSFAPGVYQSLLSGRNVMYFAGTIWIRLENGDSHEQQFCNSFTGGPLGYCAEQPF